MCFNAKVSMLTFVMGTVFSVLLILKGNKKFKVENLIFGLFLIVISMNQLMEYLFWIDLDNKNGINKITSLLGPIINAGQPIILYLLKFLIIKPDVFSMKNFNLPFFILNIAYLGSFLFSYYKYLKGSKFITKQNGEHLMWPWLKYFDSKFYLVMFALNIFYLTNLKYSGILFGLTYFILYVSYKYFNNHIGELWCFLGSFIPLVFLLISYLL